MRVSVDVCSVETQRDQDCATVGGGSTVVLQECPNSPFTILLVD